MSNSFFVLYNIYDKGMGKSGCCEFDEEWFWPFALFSKLKIHSINIEHRLNSKSVWPVWTKGMSKLKWYRSNDFS